MKIPVFFRGRRIGRFFADLVVNETVLVEIKTLPELDEVAGAAQTLNDLNCAGGGVALLVNFGKSVTFRRYVLGDPNNSLPRLRESRQTTAAPPRAARPGGEQSAKASRSAQ